MDKARKGKWVSAACAGEKEGAANEEEWVEINNDRQQGRRTTISGK